MIFVLLRCRGIARALSPLPRTSLIIESGAVGQETENRCRIEWDIKGLSPGLHGFHVHEKA